MGVCALAHLCKELFKAPHALFLQQLRKDWVVIRSQSNHNTRHHLDGVEPETVHICCQCILYRARTSQVYACAHAEKRAMARALFQLAVLGLTVGSDGSSAGIPGSDLIGALIKWPTPESKRLT